MIAGYTCDPGQEDAHAELFPATGYRRFFLGPGARPVWGRGVLAYMRPGDFPVISVKNWSPDDFRTLCRDAPVPFAFCYSHEAEDEIAAGRQTVERMVSVYRQIRTIVAESTGPQVTVTPILNWWQGMRHGFDWGQLAPVLDLTDVIGMDCYADATQASHGEYTYASELFDPLFDLGDSYGKPVAVPEYGMVLAAGDDGTRFADTMADHLQYAASGAEWLSYWCHSAKKWSYHLEADPRLGLGLRVLQGAIAATG